MLWGIHRTNTLPFPLNWPSTLASYPTSLSGSLPDSESRDNLRWGYLLGEEVPATNKDEDAPSQHGDPAAEEPVKAADSQTPVDPDEEEHIAGSGDSEGHNCWLLEDCGCGGLVRYQHTTKSEDSTWARLIARRHRKRMTIRRKGI